MPLVPAILPALDVVRSVGGLLGQRVFAVKVRVRTWTGGSRPGLGRSSDVDTQLFNQGADGTNQNPLVRYLSTKEVLASGGLYRDRDMKVGNLTPSYAAFGSMAAGGYGDATIDSAVSPGTPQEIFWNISGPGMPTGGAWMKKIGEEVTSMHYFVILRSTGEKP